MKPIRSFSKFRITRAWKKNEFYKGARGLFIRENTTTNRESKKERHKMALLF